MTPESRPPWALRNGIPPAHLVRAALRTASLIDAYGSLVPAARSAYLLYPSDALYPPQDLRLGERLLLDCGLLLEKDGYLHPTAQLGEILDLDDQNATEILFERSVLVAASDSFGPAHDLPGETEAVASELVSDPDRREAMLLALHRRHDERRNAGMGQSGEEHVVAYAREELTDLGLGDLALGVRRLSEFSDELGYDVIAPRLNGKRRLEVKTTGVFNPGRFHFFISRQEIDWGTTDEDWALVACRAASSGELTLVGWCRARALEPYLPVDGVGGRWVSAELDVPETLFDRGLPPAI